MASPYFQNLPLLSYSNTLVRDISRRTVINMKSSGLDVNFYPYEITDNIRTDQLAEYYYDDSLLEWMALLSNDIIDPYYGWYMDDDTFNKLIVDKYGDVVTAQKYIKHYINNWADDETELSVGYYNNTIADTLKKYWKPVYIRPTEISHYVRREDDIVRNTNQIIQYTISSNNDTIALQPNELVDIKYTGDTDAHANGQIVTSNSTMVRVMNVSGNTFANASVVVDLIGITSGANVSANDVVTLFENISNTEFAYYSPVSFYDWELEQREKSKNINLVSDAAIDSVVDQFERLMNFDLDANTGLSTG